VVKVGDGQVANRPFYAAIGVTVAGERDILGLWAGGAGSGEGAKFWLSVLTDLRNRGVKDVFLLVCDGLKGLPEVVSNVWPHTIVQTSSVDTVRWRDGLAGHRTTGRGPIQTRACEAPMQTCPSWWRRAA
jgi:transposase-like protein